jgi:hypothetical protein
VIGKEILTVIEGVLQAKAEIDSVWTAGADGVVASTLSD